MKQTNFKISFVLVCGFLLRNVDFGTGQDLNFEIEGRKFQLYATAVTFNQALTNCNSTYGSEMAFIKERSVALKMQDTVFRKFWSKPVGGSKENTT